MTDTLDRLTADLFKAIGHPTRVKILKLLRSEERCVCEIFENLGLEQPNTSRHLNLLKQEGILDSRKDGLKVIYWVKHPEIFKLLEIGEDIQVKEVSKTKKDIDFQIKRDNA